MTYTERMNRRIIQFIFNREWAMVLAFLGAVVLSVQSNAEVLPDDIEGYVVGPAVLLGGWLTRLRVWSGAAVAELESGESA